VQDGAVLANLELGYITTRPPGLDSVEEFRLETNNSSAKMNRPATVIVTTRSGTNSLHGSAFETARNKTFFFMNYEALRQYSAATASTTVPTEAMRRGDFSGLIDGTGRKSTIYDPWSTASKTWTRQPFPNNLIPLGRMSPMTKYLYAITPLPSQPDVNPMVRDNYFGPGPDVRREVSETIKFDHNLSNRDRLFLRQTHGDAGRKYMGNNASFPTLGDETNVSFSTLRNESVVASWTRTISPTFFSETIATWFYQYDDIAGGTRGNWAAELGLPNPLGGSLFPIITSTGFYQYRQPDNERTNRTWTYTVDQNFTKVHGHHEFQFGGRFRNSRIFELPDGSRSGQHDFSGPQTGLYDPASGSTYGATPYTGHAAANLFLGLANNYTNAFVRGMYYFRDREYAAYFQDNWRASARLTLNLGLRYEEHPPTWERNNVNFQVPQNSAATSPDGLPNYGLRSVPQYVAGVNTRNLVTFDLPPNVSRGGFTTYYMDPDQPTTGVHEWNLTFEREIVGGIVARAGYVGNHGYNLEQWAMFNLNYAHNQPSGRWPRPVDAARG
jgi:hypothetical protein